jgi:predicted adenylyl cyclase CyaB
MFQSNLRPATRARRIHVNNIEIKARLHGLKAAEAVAANLCGHGPDAILRQVDTYFEVGTGRLKLREFQGTSKSELIFYRRPDTAGPSESDYQIVPLPEAARIKSALTRALGVKAVVRKNRTLYLHNGTRIHLDEVEGLGSFIEFEVVLAAGDSRDKGEAQAQRLIAEFTIDEADLVSCSYSDLLSGG